MKNDNLIAKNPTAYHNYDITDKLETGIVLSGTEIKSIRSGKANLKDSYARVKNNEVFVINMFISKYEFGNIFNHDERRERKLLLHKQEILKIKKMLEQDGYSLVPLKLYLKKNKAKLLIGLAKGKKLYDKRESIKERDLKMAEAKNLRF